MYARAFAQLRRRCPVEIQKKFNWKVSKREFWKVWKSGTTHNGDFRQDCLQAQPAVNSAGYTLLCKENGGVQFFVTRVLYWWWHQLTFSELPVSLLRNLETNCASHRIRTDTKKRWWLLTVTRYCMSQVIRNATCKQVTEKVCSCAEDAAGGKLVKNKMSFELVWAGNAGQHSWILRLVCSGLILCGNA